MIHYLIHSPNGGIQQRGHCPTEQDVPDIEGLVVEIVDEDDPRVPGTAVRAGYQDLRRMEYPTFGDQLDAIWDVLESAGLITDTPKAKSIYDRLKAIKVAHPKK